MAGGELTTARVLITDCQTTGPTPENGCLLEAAWAVVRAVDVPDAAGVLAHLAALPDGEEIPARISRLTGITMEMMDAARPAGDIWQELQAAAGKKRCLAHFAGFEERFYRHLYFSAAPSGAFPLAIVCTHDIACRLLPDLPRRGLRALAGYFGHALPEMKRAADHVLATHFIWARLVELLAEQGVTTFTGLDAFLEAPAPKRGKRFVTPLPREERLGLHDGPGIYRFVNAAGRVIYVGKATSIRDRVNSYYRKRKKAEKELEIVSQAARVETVVTETSLEAALLEASEIKRLDPPYNTALRERARPFAGAATVAQLAAAAGYPLGRPSAVLDPALVDSWFSLVGHMETWDSDEDTLARIWSALRLDRCGVPDAGLLDEGAIFYLAELGLEPGDQLAIGLKKEGLERWREVQELKRMAGVEDELEEEEEEEPGDEDGEDEGEEEVTPELVADKILVLNLSSSVLLRRGRWLALLAGAEVGWARKDGGRRQVTLPAEPPDTLERYDFLRVLTTELRRLVRDGRNPVVRLKRGRILTGDRLARILDLV